MIRVFGPHDVTMFEYTNRRSKRDRSKGRPGSETATTSKADALDFVA